MPQNIVVQITFKGVMLMFVAAAVVWVLVQFSSLMLILFLAILLAVAITPLVDRLQVRRIPRSLAIVLIYLVLLGIVSMVIGLLVPLLHDELNQLGTNLPQSLQHAIDSPGQWLAARLPFLGGLLPQGSISDQFGTEIGTVVSSLRDILVRLGGTLLTVIINTLLVLIIGFFLTSDAAFAPRFIARFFPPRYRPTASTLAREIGARLGHWVRAQLLVCLFFG